MGAVAVFVRHPIFTVMINLALALIGLFSYTRLDVDLFPEVDKPMVTVKVTLEGASPEQIETQLTRRVEDAVALVGGIDEINSTSQMGQCNVKVRFNVGSGDAETLLQETRDRVGEIVNDFPVDTKAPTYERYSSSDTPVMVLTVSGNRSSRELTYLVNTIINDTLSTVEGVAQVEVSGDQDRQIQVNIDAAKMQEHNISVTTVMDQLKEVDQIIPGGWITSKYSEALLQISTEMETVQQFGDVVLSDTPATIQEPNSAAPVDTGAKSVVKVRDVAQVVDGAEEQRSISRYNGQPNITLKVHKNTDANLVKVAKAVNKELVELQKRLPTDVTVSVVEDTSVYVVQSVNEMTQHLILGAILASLTVLVFLGSVRLMFISAIAIPVSILSTFIMMDIAGYTLNYMTLLALTLAVGLVIDDAVVVLENVWRLMEEEGLEPEEAALRGVQEISLAVLATTCSLVILFLPLSLMPGEVGEYFRSWGTTLAFAITMSMLVSFTLTPMLCAHLLKKVERVGKPKQTWATRLVQAPYGLLLKITLKVRWLVLLLCALVVVWGLHLLKEIGKEFTAAEDEARYTLNVTLPRGWPITRISETLAPIEEELRKLKGVEGVLTTVDSGDTTQAELMVVMVPYEARKPYTQQESQAEAQALLARYPLLTALSADPDLELKLQGDDMAILTDAGMKMVSTLSQKPGFRAVTSSLQGAQPEVTVTIDRERAADLGVDPNDAGNALRVMVGGVKATDYIDADRSYDVYVRLPENQRDIPEKLQNLWVTSSNAKVGMVPLSEIARIQQGTIPAEIDRFNRRRVVTIQADLDKSLSQDKALDQAKEVLASLDLPPGYGEKESGSAQLMKETAVYAFEAFILSVVLMYMVLASQFENLIDPVLILATLPLAIPFALFSLQLAGMTLNMFSVLGLFLLFGIVKKNAILQIDRTNQLIREGVEIDKAIIDANVERLRPILMTTITLVVAMIPPALVGPTGATQSPMAVVILGGQTLCLLLTLLLIPAASSYVDRLKNFRSWKIWSIFGHGKSKQGPTE
jgi:HAE1 family hydrophobic/amphiphilic exporter-1